MEVTNIAWYPSYSQFDKMFKDNPNLLRELGIDENDSFGYYIALNILFEEQDDIRKYFKLPEKVVVPKDIADMDKEKVIEWISKKYNMMIDNCKIS